MGNKNVSQFLFCFLGNNQKVSSVPAAAYGKSSYYLNCYLYCYSSRIEAGDTYNRAELFSGLFTTLVSYGTGGLTCRLTGSLALATSAALRRFL